MLQTNILRPLVIAEPHAGDDTGTFQQVNKALELIKRKFPVKRFPGIDYDRSAPDVPVLPADVMQVICCFM